MGANYAAAPSSAESRTTSPRPPCADACRAPAAPTPALKTGDTAPKWLDAALRTAGVLKEGETL